MEAKQFSEKLLELDACSEAKEWANGKSWQQVYDTCHRGDWLLWLFKKTNPTNLRLLTLAKGHCANTVRHLIGDERSIAAVDAAISFGEGKIGNKELKNAAYAATSAAVDAAYAAYASASAAYATAAYATAAAAAAATAAAAAAAADAADAAYASADATSADAAYARIKNQQLTADICRKYLPIESFNLLTYPVGNGD